MGYFAYILKSERTGKHYYGSSQDVRARLKVHNAGKVRSTKSGTPWRVHYVEEFETRSEAVQREMFFKSVDGYRYLKERGII